MGFPYRCIQFSDTIGSILFVIWVFPTGEFQFSDTIGSILFVIWVFPTGEFQFSDTLDSEHEYCTKFKLIVNINKTKIIIFSRGRVRRFNWKYIVCYLGFPTGVFQFSSNTVVI